MQHPNFLLFRFSTVLLLLCLAGAVPAQQTWYVNAAAVPGGNGLNWALAFRDLHEALNQAQPGDQVWVAQGIYKPDTAADRSRYFQLPSGVKLYGSFAGWESTPTERNLQATPTIISGNVGNPTDSTDNSYTLLYLAYPDENTRINGFIFQHGFARGTNAANVPERLGGAVYILGNNGKATPIFEYCTFRFNAAVGGGAIGFHANTNPVHSMGLFRYCDFSFNKANTGGAIYMQGGSPADRGIEFEHCRFYENNAFEGGAIYYAKTMGTEVLDFKNCIMDDNGANYHGGFMSMVPPDGVDWAYSMDSCDIARNVCLAGANVVQVRGSFEPITSKEYIQNCSIHDHITVNTSAGGGGGGYLFYGGEDIFYIPEDIVLFNNNTYFNNKNSQNANVFLSFSGKDVKIINNKFSNSNFDVFSLYGTSNSIIKNNTFIQNTIGRLWSNSEISHNLFVDNSFSEYIFYVPYSIGKRFIYTNNLFLNNRIDSISRDLIRNGTLIAHNNIFLGNYSVQTGEPAIYLPTKVDTVILSHNLIDLPCPDNPPGPTPCGYQGSAPGVGPGGPVPAMVILASNNLTQLDPMFADTAAYDFRLLPCSPLINAGDNMYVNATTDFAGLPRIRSGTVDIGPHESQGPVLTVSPEATASCPGGASGAVQLALQDACLPVSYHWQSGSTSGSDLNQLAAGDYTFTVTDAQGQTLTFTVLVPAGDSLGFIPLASPLICGDTVGGTASASLNSGLPPLSWLWSGGSTDSLRTGLPAGTYPVTVTDANGCKAAGTVQVGKTGSLSIAIEVEEISCHSAADGALTVLPSNGKAPFAWLWHTGENSPTIGPLAPGSYLGTLTDALGCSIQWVLPLGEPSPLQTNALVTNAQDSTAANGSIELLPAGGTAPYTILWSNGASGPVLDSLLPGLYTVTLTDMHDCVVMETFVVGVTSGTWVAGDEGLMSLYPKPASNWLILESALALTQPQYLRFYDAQGRLALEQKHPEFTRSYRFDISALYTGVYFVEIECSGGQRYVEKVIVEKP